MEIKLIYILLLTSIICIRKNDNFEQVMEDLENLEKYIREYIKEKSYTESSLTHLITCYIRLGVYSTTEWNIAGGILPDNFTDYIIAKDKEYGTNAQATRTYREIEMSNKDINDFVHMFAVMNGIEYGDSYSSVYAHLVGWGGDTEQLLENIMNESGDLERLMEIAKTNYFRIKGGFDEPDLIADLDGVILLYKKNDDNNFADLIREYYTTDGYKSRVTEFVELTFPNLNDTEKFREEIFKIYYNDGFIRILECQAGLRNKGFLGCYTPGEILEKYAVHQKAAVYVVSDYFSENYKPSYITDEPYTDKPDTDIPKSDIPETDEPYTDKPDTDIPKSEVPETDKPYTDKPDTDIPKSDVPETDEPYTDKPDTDIPKSDVPDTDIPKSDKSETDESGTDIPETSSPETDQSKTDQPKSDESTDQIESDETKSDETDTDKSHSESKYLRYLSLWILILFL